MCSSDLTLDNNIGMLAEASVLPIILSSFDASSDNETVRVQWSTASEINTKHFIIEHSVTGQPNSWAAKAKINASGYSMTAKRYTWTDNSPNPGGNYYRLRSVDNDNSFSVSNSEYVHISKISAQTINAFPIPFGDIINLSGVEKGSIITLSDLSGKMIVQQTATGVGREKIIANNLVAGTYFIKVTSASGESKSIKINKQ